MPYLITTRTTSYAPSASGQWGATERHSTTTRRAIATLEEARRAVRAAYEEQHAPGAITAMTAIAEAGGRVGPLPDGTMIEVAPMVNEFGRPDVRGYLRSWHFPASMDDAEILNAYNAAQEV